MGIQKALLCLSTILSSLLSSTTTITAAKDDSVAMAKLAATLHPTPSGWSINSPYCNWPGVTCESQFNRVISIHLDAMFLSSNLPSELSSLTQLQVLSLANNSLFGSIPSGLSSLAQLLVLDLSNNSLSGSLPDLANLTLLQELCLDHNNFTTIPPGFFQGLSGLAYFSISNNIYLEPWTIPTELNQLTNLTLFEANNANVMGSLPDIFYAFPDLTFLILSNNNLTGSLPASFEKTVIQILLLDHQEIGLTGTIDVLSQMTLLNRVLLDNNQFTGPIPDLSNCTYLYELQLSENLLTGLVPTSLISLLSLLNISLANNMLQGPSPVFQKNVQIAVYDNNNFCTNYGDACDPQVTILLEIAAALDYPLRLSEYWKGNDACKDWPFITCNSLGSITMINLTKQHFGGTISPAFADLTELQILILNENNLTGSIPDSLTKSPHLQILDVSNNNLSGEIPHFASSVKLNANGNAILYTIGIPNGDGPPAANIKVSKEKKISIVLIITAVIIGTITIATCTFFSWSLFAKHKARKEKSKTIRNEKGEVILLINGGEASTKFSGHNVIGGNKNPIRHQELALLNYEKLSTATNNFHLENKLGEGGFGPVYKGKLQDGKEIAVKRLSRTSGQGLEEFINEVMVLSKLQHRNLVRLLGCCVEGKEKMLVYEYMPNKSLDAFIFDPHKEEILDWRKRLKIIEGIARGILYLHRDSRLKIIHRDLKPNNILLDKELSPKISDFGMARIFGGTEDQANTKRVVGTYGYMSPEYAMEGLFSEKSDVFSFGVLLLEIVGGRRNTSFSNNEHALSLLGYAWKLWNEGNIVAIIDPLLSDPCFQTEILKCIQVGLLCVQKSPKDRPTISNVILMLDSEINYLPTPKQPAFTDTQFAKVTGSCQQRHQRFSINNVTITTIEGR